MKVKSSPGAEHYALRRSLAGVFGIAVGSTALAGVIVLFGDASSMPWLPATPANIAVLKRCDGVPGTAARHACIEAVIAEVKARDAAQRFATNEPQVGPQWPTN